MNVPLPSVYRGIGGEAGITFRWVIPLFCFVWPVATTLDRETASG